MYARLMAVSVDNGVWPRAINGAGKEFRSQQLGSVESRNRGRADSREFQELLRLGQASSLEAVQRVLAPVLPAWKENPRLSTAILCRLAKKKCARTCMKVLEAMKSKELGVNVFHYSAAISACEKGGQWQSALHLFSVMPEANVLPDTICYNAAISACEKGGEWQSALQFLSMMPDAKVTQDTISYSAAISACEKGGQWQSALRLLSLIPEAKLSTDAISYNAAISACEKGGQWQSALRLLSLMPEAKISTDAISYNAAISACEKGGQWQSALHFLSMMPDVKVTQDTISYSAAISACEKGGQWQSALCLFNLMPGAKVTQNVISYNAAISACEKGGQWQSALRLLSLMTDAKVLPGTISYSAAISASEKRGQWQLALRLLSLMPEAKVTQNAISYNAAISACEKGGQWQSALHLLSVMPDAKVMPGTISYNAAISACEKGGQWQSALHFLSLMPEAKVMPDMISYNAAISACEKADRWESALHLLSLMPEAKAAPDTVSYHAAISACETGRHWEVGLVLLYDMCRSKLSPNGVEGIACGSVLSSVRKAVGKSKALELLKGFRKEWLRSDSETMSHGGVNSSPDSAHDLEIVGKSTGIVAVSKPSGVTTEDAWAILEHQIQEQVTGVSRLDAPTSGVLPVAIGGKNSASAKWLEAQFAARLVAKTYLCLCFGSIPGGPGQRDEISSPLQVVPTGLDSSRVVISQLGKKACTQYEVLSTYKDPVSMLTAERVFPPEDASRALLLSLVRAWPLTGRTHQIRAHLASIGLPLVGDRLYGKTLENNAKGTNSVSARDPSWCQRLFLHCCRLELLSLSNEELLLEAPLPDELVKALTQLELVAGQDVLAALGKNAYALQSFAPDGSGKGRAIYNCAQ